MPLRDERLAVSNESKQRERDEERRQREDNALADAIEHAWRSSVFRSPTVPAAVVIQRIRGGR